MDRLPHGGSLPKDYLARLSTQDKLLLVNAPNQCQQVGLAYIDGFWNKATFYDRYQRTYWSVWDPSITEISDLDFSPEPILLEPAHEAVDFAAEAQAIHFYLSDRLDLAEQIMVKHGLDVAVVVIPEIPGKEADWELYEWEKKGYPEGQRPITLNMFADFVKAMLHENAPIQTDIVGNNVIIGEDERLYCIDFSLRLAKEQTKEGVRTSLIFLALGCKLKWEELPLELRESIEFDEQEYLEYFG